MLLCVALFASVARCATQVLVPGRISFVLKLTRWKGVPMQMFLARRALQLHLAFDTYLGYSFERIYMLLCVAILASVARCATQVLVLVRISFVLKLTGWKGVAMQMSFARRTLQPPLAVHTYVGFTIERTYILLCSAFLASVATNATQVLVPCCISFVLYLTHWKSIAGYVLLADCACHFVLLLVTYTA